MRKVVAHMQVLCDNSDYLLTCLNTSIEGIKSVSSNFTIPQYQELFDESFEPIATNGSLSSGLKNDIAEFSAKLPSAGHSLDNEMAIVASNIAKIKSWNVDAESNNVSLVYF